MSNFEKFLQEKHNKHFEKLFGKKKSLKEKQEHFEGWLEVISIEEWIDYGDEFAETKKD